MEEEVKDQSFEFLPKEPQDKIPPKAILNNNQKIISFNDYYYQNN